MATHRNLSALSWVLCLFSIAAWIGVGSFIGDIRSLQDMHSSSAATSQRRSVQAMQAANQHAMVVSAQPAQSQLDALSQVDPTHIAQAITSAGTAAGVTIDIKSATQGALTALDSKSSVQSYTFLVSAQGSFVSLIRAAQLLEVLPIPASMSQLQFTHLPPGQGGPKDAAWEMTVQLQVVSTLKS